MPRSYYRCCRIPSGSRSHNPKFLHFPDRQQGIVIAPEESWEQDYPTITLTYYEGDGVLTDDHDKIITNADELVGPDFAQHFGEYEEDSVYVRNSKLKVHYEILRDYGAYVDRMSESE